MNYTLVGGDAEQQAYVAEVLDNERLPFLKWPITIRIADTGTYFNGLANPWTVKLSDRLRPDSRYWRYVIVHEVGHVFDLHFLTDADRAVLIGFFPDETEQGWHGAFTAHRKRPKERFADEFENFIRCREQDFVPRSLIGRLIYHADVSWGLRNSTVLWGCS